MWRLLLLVTSKLFYWYKTLSIMNITDIFTQILLEDTNKKVAKKSSLIQDWLGTTQVSQSVSIRVGNYLETFFCKVMGDKNKLDFLPLKGRNNIITVDGEDHQVDLLGQVEDGVLITREMKCNLDLDRGKTRDTIRREEQIERGLEEQFDVSVDGGISVLSIMVQSRKMVNLE